MARTKIFATKALILDWFANFDKKTAEAKAKRQTAATIREIPGIGDTERNEINNTFHALAAELEKDAQKTAHKIAARFDAKVRVLIANGDTEGFRKLVSVILPYFPDDAKDAGIEDFAGEEEDETSEVVTAK